MNYLWGSSSSSSSTNSKSTNVESGLKRKLRVRVGPSVQTLTTCKVNDDSNPHFIDSPYFVGHIIIRIKNFEGITPDGSAPIKTAPYFGSKRRLFSIQLSGRFKQEYSVDDVLFGAEFNDKVSPPMGTSIAVKFANYIDPALQTDVYAAKPWLYSPMLCSMNIVNVQKTAITSAPSSVAALLSDKASLSSKSSLRVLDEVSKSSSSIRCSPSPKEILGDWVWGGERELEEDNSLLFSDDLKTKPFQKDDISERRKYFQKSSNRQNTKFYPDRVYHLEIFAPFIDLNTFDLTLGINVNLVRYLNKQPIRLMAKSQSKNVPFFVMEFDLLDEQGRGLANISESEVSSADLSDEQLSEEEVAKKMAELDAVKQN